MGARPVAADLQGRHHLIRVPLVRVIVRLQQDERPGAKHDDITGVVGPACSMRSFVGGVQQSLVASCPGLAGSTNSASSAPPCRSSRNESSVMGSPRAVRDLSAPPARYIPTVCMPGDHHRSSLTSLPSGANQARSLGPPADGGPALEEVPVPEDGVCPAEPYQQPGELEQIPLPRREIPVDPRDLVVLAVGVVVAALGAAHLVTGGDHRHAGRQQQGRQQVAHGAAARSASISGSAVSPSTPWFHERLWSEPSRLCSPLASLCLRSYVTRSRNVNPSWAVTKLTDENGRRPSSP